MLAADSYLADERLAWGPSVPTEPGQGSVVIPEAASTTLAAFVVEAGRPGATQVEGPTGASSASQSEIDGGLQRLADGESW